MKQDGGIQIILKCSERRRGQAGTESLGKALGFWSSPNPFFFSPSPFLSLLPVFCALLSSPSCLDAYGSNLMLHPPNPPIHLISFPMCDLVVWRALNASSGVAGGEQKEDGGKRLIC